jgi:hypothetical protein
MIDYMKPEDVPVCKCGDLCDRQTLKGTWHHSACDDEAKARIERTRRILAVRDGILNREGSKVKG